MLDLLSKNVGDLQDLSNEMQLHNIVQEMSSLCQPNTKLKEVRKAIAQQSLMDYIFNAEFDIDDEQKIQKLQKLNAKLDTSQRANGRLWNKLASQFMYKKNVPQALKYLEMAINYNCEKEAVQYLLEEHKKNKVGVKDIPLSLFKAAFTASIDANQLTNLLLIIPKYGEKIERNQKVKGLPELIEQMKISVELDNMEGSTIVRKLSTDLAAIVNLKDTILNDKKISDRVKIKLMKAIAKGLALGREDLEPERKELIENIEQLKQNIELLYNIKEVMKKSSDKNKEKLNEKEFLNNKEYRERIINDYAKVMVGMNVAKKTLMNLFKGNDYIVLSISAQFEKALSYGELVKECDACMTDTNLDIPRIIQAKILPLCTQNTHFLYCISKIISTGEIEIYNALALVINEVAIQYFYDFGNSLVLKEPAIPEEHKEIIKKLAEQDDTNTDFSNKLYMSTFESITDINLYVYYNLISDLQRIKFTKLQPLIVLPLLLLKKLNWIRPQIDASRSRYMRDSSATAYRWIFSKVTLESFLVKDPQKVALKLVNYFRVLLEYELKKEPESLNIGVISKAVHKLVKQQFLAFKDDGSGYLLASEILYQLSKNSAVFADRSELCKFIAKSKSIETYSIIDYCIKTSKNTKNVLVMILERYGKEIEASLRVSLYIKDMLACLVEAFTISKKIPLLPLYYGLDSLKLNESLEAIKNRWTIAQSLESYINFAKLVFPEIANLSLKKLWIAPCDVTVKNIALMTFEDDFRSLYGDEPIKTHLLKTALNQLGKVYKDFKTAEEVIRVMEGYVKDGTLKSAKDYCNLLSLGVISAKYIEKKSKGIGLFTL